MMNKKVGETPLQCLDRLRFERPELANMRMTYAGRLDPMADGVLLVLVGDECKRKEDFLGLDKEYVCEILWGFSTDTYDILGKIVRESLHVPDLEKMTAVLQKFVGKSQQKFPPYSSKPVQGKPLYEWARALRLDEIEIPSKEIEIKSIELLGSDVISAKEMKEKILSRLATVCGDFRQEEIIVGWNDRLEKTTINVVVSRIRIICSTGTYIRGLVQELGQTVGMGAAVLSLTRMRVGDHSII